MKFINLLLLTLLLVQPIFLLAESSQQPQLKRMAISVGANNGGNERVLLKYAQSDAKAFARVIKELGGVNPNDISLLLEPTRSEFKMALNTIRKRLTTAKKDARRVEIIVYYSGHADESGMLLGDEKFTYEDFKTAITDMPADIRIAVLDACAAGAMTRLKGGKRQPAFLVDESSDMRGHAFLTSNTADEAAQESDKIQGSFFTNSLLSGLRGAADLTQDGQVTLNEAYQYAFHETLARTENTMGGPQHAGYDMNLTGTGEVVITDLRGTSAILSLAKDMNGRVFIRDENGMLIVELHKYKGRSIDLGVEPGKYHVTLEKKQSRYQSEVLANKGETLVVDEKIMSQVSAEFAVSRGSLAKETVVVAEMDTIPVSWAIFPDLYKKDGDLKLQNTFHYYSFNLIAGSYTELKGVGVGLVGQRAAQRVKGGQFSIVGNDAGESLDGVQASIGFNNAKFIDGVQSTIGINVSHELNGVQVSIGTNIAQQVKGGQWSVGLNMTGDSLIGAQGAVGVNIATDVKGGQGAVFGNLARDVSGGQGSIFANVARDVNGGQGTIFGNLARDVSGGQGSIFANVARDVIGGQGAIFANYSGKVEGGQGSIFLNVAGEIDGGQGAIFGNYAGNIVGGQVAFFMNTALHVDGFQIGVINLAQTVKGETIGLLNLNTDAQIHPGLWLDEAGVMNISLKTGMKHFYGMFNIGFLGSDNRYQNSIASRGFGIGAQIPINEMIFSSDITINHLTSSDGLFSKWQHDLTRIRFGVSAELYNHLRPTMGLSLNFRSRNKDTIYHDYFSENPWGQNDDIGFWPGFFVGIDF